MGTLIACMASGLLFLIPYVIFKDLKEDRNKAREILEDIFGNFLVYVWLILSVYALILILS